MSKIVKASAWASGVLLVLALLLFMFGRWYMGVLFAPIDSVAPQLPANFNRPAVLVFNKANGFVHTDALPAGNQLLKKLAKKHGWFLYITDNGAVMQQDLLSKFDVVVWNNTSGTTLSADQQATFRHWLESGGGFVGIHAAGGDPWYQWDWYVNKLIGAQFVGHTMSPQFQDAEILKTAENSITASISSSWRVSAEEWYAFDRNPRDAGMEILLALNENSYSPASTSMAGEHPITWRHKLGEGRVFYTAIGHQAATYRTPEFQSLIEAAMQWAGGW